MLVSILNWQKNVRPSEILIVVSWEIVTIVQFDFSFESKMPWSLHAVKIKAFYINIIIHMIIIGVFVWLHIWHFDVECLK